MKVCAYDDIVSRMADLWDSAVAQLLLLSRLSGDTDGSGTDNRLMTDSI